MQRSVRTSRVGCWRQPEVINVQTVSIGWLKMKAAVIICRPLTFSGWSMMTISPFFTRAS